VNAVIIGDEDAHFISLCPAGRRSSLVIARSEAPKQSRKITGLPRRLRGSLLAMTHYTRSITVMPPI
jgi:hypothetical protein